MTARRHPPKQDSKGRFGWEWTPEENVRLRELLAKYGFDRAAKMLERPPMGVRAQAQRLGYSIGDREGWYTLGEVAGILGVTFYFVRNRIERGLLKGEHMKKGKSEKGGVYWVIKDRDLRNYMRRYPQDLYGKPIDVVAFVDILCPDGLLVG